MFPSSKAFLRGVGTGLAGLPPYPGALLPIGVGGGLIGGSGRVIRRDLREALQILFIPRPFAWRDFSSPVSLLDTTLQSPAPALGPPRPLAGHLNGLSLAQNSAEK